MIKKLLCVAALVWGTVATAQQDERSRFERMRWSNILELYPNSYAVNTISVPNRVLRPSFGGYLKVEVSGCGDVNYSGISAFEWDRFNRVLPINIERRDSKFERFGQTHYYNVKGRPTTVQFIGLQMNLSNIRSCRITVFSARD